MFLSNYLHHGSELNGIFPPSVLNLDALFPRPKGIIDLLVVGSCIRAPLAVGDVEPLPRVGAYLR